MEDSRQIPPLLVETRKYFAERVMKCKPDLMQDGLVVDSAGKVTMKLGLGTPNWMRFLAKDALGKYAVTLSQKNTDYVSLSL